ncbi:MAG: hypothetical protein K6B40_02380 [Firmicutes bacterium]|nr:hypothetical protein [Bacillota bacterium]
MEIIVDRHAGFCTGVRRAIALAEDAAHKYGSCCTWGQLIHNPQEIARLKKKTCFRLRTLGKSSLRVW